LGIYGGLGKGVVRAVEMKENGVEILRRYPLDINRCNSPGGHAVLEAATAT